MTPEADATSRASSPPRSLVKGLVKMVRPHQWAKNAFVVAPMFFHKDLVVSTSDGTPALNLDVTGRAFAGMFVFCLLAGAVYTMNDLVDVEADRVHPVKRLRPIASGAVPESIAKVCAALLVVTSLSFAVLLSWRFAAVALIYFVENVLYSFKLKKVAYLDVSLIALGFVLRVVAGGLVTHTHVSNYMFACTAFLALFLGFGKRRHELESEKAGKQREALEAYGKRSLNAALLLTGALTVATYIAYTLDPVTRQFFKSDWLWITVPSTLFGIGRFLALVSGHARHGKKAESPTQAMLSDVPFVANLLVWIVIVAVLVYRLRPG
jgi:4-hydroxybenzoate polyprenyltransferase